jgi:23S rRNA (adenine2503-C2)-methyltransferase
MDLKSMNEDELIEVVEALGEKAYRGRQIYTWLHQKQAFTLEEMTNISKSLKEKIAGRCSLTQLNIEQVLTSAVDGTKKYLFSLADGNVIESVLMGYHHGYSVCISSQAGCRMGCRFCASGQNGLARNLTTGEMLSQVYQIQAEAGVRIANVVVMGTGEPLDNYDNLMKFIKILSDENGLHISQRAITVSTCGIIPKIYQMAAEKLQITLAISLHAVDQQKREALMPIAHKYELTALLTACQVYFAQTRRRITFEYALAADVNDSVADARTLVKLLDRFLTHNGYHVNLIPINPVKEAVYFPAPGNSIHSFKKELEKQGIHVTIRREMGRDINGACGQLRQSVLDMDSKGGEDR